MPGFRRRKSKRYSQKKKSFGRKNMGAIPSYTTRITRGVQRSTVVSDESLVKLKRSFLLNIADNTPSNNYFHFDFNGNSFGQHSTSATTDSLTNSFATTLTGPGMSNDDFPAGLQNWALFYEGFRVMGSKIKVEAINGASQGNNIIGIIPQQFDETPGLTRDSVMDHPYVKYRQLSGNGGSDRCLLSAFMKTKKMAGRSGIGFDNNYQGSFTYSGAPAVFSGITDPAKLWIWNVFGIKPLGTDNMVVNAVVTITYYVRLERRKNQYTVNNTQTPN